MNKISVITIVSVFMITSVAFGADITGTWELSGNCLRLGEGQHLEGDPQPLGGHMVITYQADGLFEGYVCDVELPNGRFFGAIEGRVIYMTQWDAIVVGELNKKDFDKFTAVTHHQQFNPGSAPGTCLAEAEKTSDLPTCCPDWPNAFVYSPFGGGECSFECHKGYADCDGISDNGCEYPLLLVGTGCPESSE